MPPNGEKHITLDRFLVQRQKNYPGATGELTQVIKQMGVVAKIISSYMRRASLEGLKGLTGTENIQGEAVKKLDALGNTVFEEAFDYVDIVGAIASEETQTPKPLSSDKSREKYVVLVDPIDGSSNLDVDCLTGSIFSVHDLSRSLESSILQKGSTQVAAGYLMYSTSVILVYSAGDGVHSFVLDEQIGEFVLDHEDLRIPKKNGIVSANFGNYSKWSAPARGFADHIMQKTKERYSLRYSGALVADLHQVLHQGGIYFYPDDTSKPEGKLRLLYECAPIAMIAEQAGGAATTGTTRIMDIVPQDVHQRVPFAVGSRDEIDLYESYYESG